MKQELLLNYIRNLEFIFYGLVLYCQ